MKWSRKLSLERRSGQGLEKWNLCYLQFKVTVLSVSSKLITSLHLLWKWSMASFPSCVMMTHHSFTSRSTLPCYFRQHFTIFLYLICLLHSVLTSNSLSTFLGQKPVLLQFPFHWFICIPLRINESVAVLTKVMFVWVLASLLLRLLLHQRLVMIDLCKLAVFRPGKTQALGTKCGKKQRENTDKKAFRY